MKKYFLPLTSAALYFISSSLIAGDGSCARCEVIREENKHKTNPYVFYEDYLKDHPEEAENLTQSGNKTEDSQSLGKGADQAKQTVVD